MSPASGKGIREIRYLWGDENLHDVIKAYGKKYGDHYDGGDAAKDIYSG